jgi:8-oxo-dGTP pyrophosphatase MutT (NUDIX family)
MIEHKGSFDPKTSRGQEYRDGTAGVAVRPRDASTLIIVKRDAAMPQVLMGQRHADHKFMPNKFVFPGGRVDPADGRIRAVEELRDPVRARLMTKMRGPATEQRARALAMAAIRETFEETGLILGRAVDAPQKSKNADWNAYLTNGVAPALGALDFVARAVTPPYRTRRFDTRFFIADAEHIQGDPLMVAGSGELQGLHWISLDEAGDLDLPNITRTILDELKARLALGSAAQLARPTPFIYFRNGKSVIEQIGD